MFLFSYLFTYLHILITIKLRVEFKICSLLNKTVRTNFGKKVLPYYRLLIIVIGAIRGVGRAKPPKTGIALTFFFLNIIFLVLGRKTPNDGISFIK